jgi:hypothetical protein
MYSGKSGHDGVGVSRILQHRADFLREEGKMVEAEACLSEMADSLAHAEEMYPKREDLPPMTCRARWALGNSLRKSRRVEELEKVLQDARHGLENAIHRFPNLIRLQFDLAFTFRLLCRSRHRTRTDCGCRASLPRGASGYSALPVLATGQRLTRATRQMCCWLWSNCSAIKAAGAISKRSSAGGILTRKGHLIDNHPLISTALHALGTDLLESKTPGI